MSIAPEERQAILARAYPEQDPEQGIAAQLGGREVHGWALALVTVVTLILALALSPLIIAGHAILRACGRQGFMARKWEEDRPSYVWSLGPYSFSRR